MRLIDRHERHLPFCHSSSDCHHRYHYEDHKKEDVYYTGTMICYPERSHYSVIDGQQRITTLSLLFIAMRDLIDTSSLNPTEKVQFLGEGLEVKDLCKKISKVTIGTKKNPRLLPKQDQKNNVQKVFYG